MEPNKKNQVKYKFIDEKDIPQHIINIYSRQNNKGSKAKGNSAKAFIEIDSLPKIDKENAVQVSSALGNEDGDFCGSELFKISASKTPMKSSKGISTPSKSRKTPQKGCLTPNTKAWLSSEPTTDLQDCSSPTSNRITRSAMKENSERVFTTPKSKGTRNVSTTSQNGLNTPKIQSVRRNLLKTPTSAIKRKIFQEDKLLKTPKHVRLHVRNELNKRLDQTDVCDMENTDDEESDSSEEEKEVEVPAAKNIKSALTLAHFGETYFGQSGRKCLTSNHTLSKLDQPKLELEALHSLLREAPPHHANIDLTEDCVQDFESWLYHLNENFNILLYGAGSKLNLMERFCDLLEDYDHIFIHGFFPGLTIKHLLNSITTEVLEEEGKTFGSITQHMEFILDHYNTGDADDLYLVIANIDGHTLRSDRAQTVLSHLAANPKIHILASIDHINSSLLWDQIKLSRFEWVWHNVTNFEPYYVETSYETSLLVQHSAQLALSSLQHVFNSLTPNARGIFLLLTQNQINEKKNKQFQGMLFKDLYQECRSSFLVNSELTLHAHMVEFRDHKLITFKKASSGDELLFIPLEMCSLEEFFEEHKEELN